MISAQVSIKRVEPVRRAGGLAEVGLMAYPVVLQTLSDTLMHVTDSAIVGRLGTTELAAVGFGAIWLWTLLAGFVGTANGVQTFVAQAFGAGHRKQCGPWAWQAIYTLVPAAIVWAIVIALGFPTLLTWLRAPSELADAAAAYAAGRLPGFPALVSGAVLGAFFRGLGDTRTPLIGTIVANVANTTLAIGFVFGKFYLPELGVMGAGVATAIANWIYFAILLVVLLRPQRRKTYAAQPCAPNVAAIRRFLRTSIPVGGTWSLDMVTFALFSTIIAWMGNAQMAASQAMIQLLSLSFMQAHGISIASGALVGRYIGGRDLEAAQRTHRSALHLGLIVAVIVACLFVMIPGPLLRIFTNDPNVLALGAPLLALGAMFQLVDAVGIIAGGALRGAGDTRFPFLVQAVLAWLLRLPLVYAAAIVLEGGVLGAWLGELGYVAVLSVIWMMRFQHGAWRSIRI